MRIAKRDMRRIAQAFVERRELVITDVRCIHRGNVERYKDGLRACPPEFASLMIVQVFNARVPRWSYVFQEDMRGSVSFIDYHRATKAPTISPHGHGLEAFVNELCLALGDEPRVKYDGRTMLGLPDETPLPQVGKVSYLLYNPLAYLALRAARADEPRALDDVPPDYDWD